MRWLLWVAVVPSGCLNGPMVSGCVREVGVPTVEGK